MVLDGVDLNCQQGKKSIVMVKLKIYDARRPIAALPTG